MQGHARYSSVPSKTLNTRLNQAPGGPTPLWVGNIEPGEPGPSGHLAAAPHCRGSGVRGIRPCWCHPGLPMAAKWSGQGQTWQLQGMQTRKWCEAGRPVLMGPMCVLTETQDGHRHGRGLQPEPGPRHRAGGHQAAGRPRRGRGQAGVTAQHRPQVEGAFLQGAGLYTTEELHYSPEGALLSGGPEEYKIPTAADVPEKLNVTLLPSAQAQTGLTIYSSKVSTYPLRTAGSRPGETPGRHRWTDLGNQLQRTGAPAEIRPCPQNTQSPACCGFSWEPRLHCRASELCQVWRCTPGTSAPNK